MRNAIAIRHIAFEDAGTLEGVLQDRGIALRYLEDLDDTAIAGILNCSEVTVRSHISRGLARLRDAAPGGRD